jgi:hypothetical protein
MLEQIARTPGGIALIFATCTSVGIVLGFLIGNRNVRDLVTTLWRCNVCGVLAWCPPGSARAAFWKEYGCPCCQQGRMEKFYSDKSSAGENS